MNFTQAVQSCLSQYVTFSGRARRSEYWYFVLFAVGLGIFASILDGSFFGADLDDNQPISSIISLLLFLPTLSVSVRRLHDLGKSGWWWWLWLLPLIGWIIMLIWYVGKGTDGANQYGPDPFGGPSDFGDQNFSHKSSIPKISRDD